MASLQMLEGFGVDSVVADSWVFLSAPTGGNGGRHDYGDDDSNDSEANRESEFWCQTSTPWHVPHRIASSFI